MGATGILRAASSAGRNAASWARREKTMAFLEPQNSGGTEPPSHDETPRTETEQEEGAKMMTKAQQMQIDKEREGVKAATKR